MNSTLLKQAEDLFDALADLPPGDRRPILENGCTDNGQLRSLVEQLLANHDTGLGTFMSQPVLRPPPDVEPPSVSGIPKRIGQYEIVRVIGEGGMAVVYEARQKNPTRNVAIKMLRCPLPSAELVRRFEYEVEVLAKLNHPGVAQIYEAGMTASDEIGHRTLPFFAMELVDGRSIVEFARERNLDTRSRLDLIAQVCDAVHFAHQRGVIHRDLKPANILVDHAGRPKVLDFGVARALATNGASRTRHTRTHALVGTLAYMSPEQAAGDNDSIDTRSDVYSLGVCLFELLTGRLPHDCADCSVREAARRICEDEPTRVSSTNAGLRGEIDTIVAKCLEKTPALRYSSAADFAADIRRYLCGDPIEARRHSRVYLLRKTLHRYRWPVAMTVILVAGLAAFSVYASVEAGHQRVLTLAEQRASQRARDAQQVAEEQRSVAQREAALAQASKRFLQRMIEAADPQRAGGPDVPVSQVLNDAAESLEAGELADQPAVEADIRSTLARTYFNLGLHLAAIPHYEWLNDYYTNEFGEANLQTLMNLTRLGTAYTEVWRTEESKAAFERCLELAAAEHGDRHELTLLAMDGLGEVLALMGRVDEAEPFHLEALAGVEEALGREHELFVSTTFHLGSVYGAQGRLQDAEQLYLRALERSENLHGPESYITIRIRWKLARDIYRRTGRLEEAETLLRETLELALRGLGNGHTETNIVLIHLSRVLDAEGKSEEGEQLLRDAIVGFSEIRGIEGNDTIEVVRELSTMLRRRGEHDEAARVLRDAIDRAIQLHGDEYSNLATTLHLYAGVLAGMGDYAGAAVAAKRVLGIRQRVFGSSHTSVASTVQSIGWYLDCDGSYDEALEWFQRSLAMRRELSGETHRETIRATITLSALLLRMGDETAYYLLRDRYQLVRAAWGETHKDTQYIAAYLARYLSGGGRHEEAIQLDRDMLAGLTVRYGEGALENGIWWKNLAAHLCYADDSSGSVAAYQTALSIYRAHGKEESVAALATRRGLAEALLAGGEPADALPFARQSWDGHCNVVGKRSVTTVDATLTLGQALVELGEADEAEELLREAVALLDELPLSQSSADYYRPRANSVLGLCLTAQGRYDEAEPLLIDAFEHLLQFDLQHQFETRQAQIRVVALYEAWGKPENAAAYFPPAN